MRALVDMLQNPGYRRWREAVSTALGKRGGEEAKALLLARWLLEVSRSREEGPIHARLREGDYLISGIVRLDPASLQALWTDFLASHPGEAERNYLLHKMKDAPADFCVPLFREVLFSDAPPHRKTQAIIALAEVKDERAVGALMELIRRPDLLNEDQLIRVAGSLSGHPERAKVPLDELTLAFDGAANASERLFLGRMIAERVPEDSASPLWRTLVPLADGELTSEKADLRSAAWTIKALSARAGSEGMNQLVGWLDQTAGDGAAETALVTAVISRRADSSTPWLFISQILLVRPLGEAATGDLLQWATLQKPDVFEPHVLKALAASETPSLTMRCANLLHKTKGDAAIPLLEQAMELAAVEEKRLLLSEMIDAMRRKRE